MASHNTAVPLSGSLINRQGDSHTDRRDTSQTVRGTPSLKALARAIINRDSMGDSGAEDKLVSSVPLSASVELGQTDRDKCITRRMQFNPPVHDNPDLCLFLDEYEERAAIIEFDGGLSRMEAEQQARGECVKRWMQLIVQH